MSDILIIFISIVFMLSLIITVIGEIVYRGASEDIDLQYYDSNGDHIYYERSLIEKKMFRKRYPHAEIRKLSNMFKRRGRVAQV